jgi:hypothetical protein
MMEPLDGGFEPNAEVDRMRWLTIEEALAALSYPIDRALLSAQELC